MIDRSGMLHNTPSAAANSPEDEEGRGRRVEADYPIHDAAKEDALAEAQGHVADEARQIVGQAVIALAGAFPVDDATLWQQ